MPYRKLTGQISERHPFHGYYTSPDMYDFDVAAVDKLYKGVQGYDSVVQRIPAIMFETIAIGAIAYGVARVLLKKSPKTSEKWGLIGGGATAALNVVYFGLQRESAY